MVRFQRRNQLDERHWLSQKHRQYDWLQYNEAAIMFSGGIHAEWGFIALFKETKIKGQLQPFHKSCHLSLNQISTWPFCSRESIVAV